MSSSVISTTSSNNSNNNNTVSNTDSNTSSMQDLLNLLQEQSKVICVLQRTIESLNVTIKNMNDKNQKLEAPKHVEVTVEGVEVVRKVVKELTDGEVIKSSNDHLKSVHENVVNNRLNVAVNSKNDHLKTAHENAEQPKCQRGDEENKNTSKLVHENVKLSLCDNDNCILESVEMDAVHENTNLSKMQANAAKFASIINNLPTNQQSKKLPKENKSGKNKLNGVVGVNLDQNRFSELANLDGRFWDLNYFTL